MPSNAASSPSSTPTHAVRPASRHSHDDAPDTASLFARLAALEDGPERDVLRDELVAA
ncbi:B/F/G family RNA polymerase sigma-70 factor, partial [Streptomyces sp. NPDC059224]